MVRHTSNWACWTITFLCACSATVPPLPVQKLDTTRPAVLVIHPAGDKPVQLSSEELKQGMRMLFARGPLPGAPKGVKPRFILMSADPAAALKAAGYLQFCERFTGQRKDCWDVLNGSGGLDDSGTTELAVRFAFGEALRDAASAVGSSTPDHVRAV